MDVKALYPSMEWDAIVAAVKEMILKSKMKVDNVDWREVAKYIAVEIPSEEIEKEGLSLVIPKKKGRPGRKRTINFLQNKKNDSKWTVARKPGARQKQKMLALVISHGVLKVMSNHTYTVGDDHFLQSRGGAIGAELTGAVSRPFMWRWDNLYLDKVREAGMKMKVYERYVDDSNQIAETPPIGARYDNFSRRVVTDVNPDHRSDDARTAEVLKQIANDVMDGIAMEEDYPSKNENRKLAILDMTVWLDISSHLVYQHYEKPTASKRVLSEQSGQSTACKKSVHVRELVRRLLNTSSKLDWDSMTAPILTEYMGRMLVAGYDEGYRRSCLGHALRIYDSMVLDDIEGKRPIHRPRDWNREERRIDKKNKKYTWSTKGGYIAPILVPATPNSELVHLLQKVAEEEAIPGLKFKVLETGGVTVKHKIQKSNPLASPGCIDNNCLACKRGRGEGGPCRKSNVGYQMECILCDDAAAQNNNQDCRTTYIGETSRNIYSRGKEHMYKYNSANPDSFMWKHQQEVHDCLQAAFNTRVTGSFRDCLTRQVAEGVAIRRCKTAVLNSKSEWHQPSLWKVRSELEQG
jgi:hypothetical protein